MLSRVERMCRTSRWHGNTSMVSCGRCVNRKPAGGARVRYEGHVFLRVSNAAVMSSCAVDRGAVIRARIRSSASSTNSPFLAASIVVE